MDVFLKFSSESLLVLLAFLIALWNLYALSNAENYSDSSHAARLILQNPHLNEKLYSRMAEINTVVVKNGSFVPRAYAEDFMGVPAMGINVENLDNENLLWQEESLIAPSSDSVQQYLAKQIKVYETKDGDTLAKIAKENNLTVNTLIWANKLPSATIKSGWFLLIPPTDGILHKATSNNTLPDLAKKYGVTVDSIIAYNGLANAEDIDEGQLLIIPGGKMPEAPKPKTSTPRDNSKVKPNGVVKPKIVDNGTGHIFPWGYCTWYVASKVHVPWGGNAKNWLSNAAAYGAIIVNHAVPGSIVVTTDNRKWGHVALVESVDEDGFTISEMNYKKFGTVNTRYIPHNSKIVRGFIIR